MAIVDADESSLTAQSVCGHLALSQTNRLNFRNGYHEHYQSRVLLAMYYYHYYYCCYRLLLLVISHVI